MDESDADDGHRRMMPEPPEAEGEGEHDALVRLGEVMGEIDRRARTIVLEHPVLALSGAVALGWILGRLVTRR